MVDLLRERDWLPHIDVVKLPDSLRAADPRALQVRDRDAGDYPAAALAAGAAAEVTYQGRQLLRACLVPRPEQRSTASAILPELALAPESLSAQQLAELLDPSVRPPVADLRAWLRHHDGTIFHQFRRGGFVLGSRFQLPD